MIIRTYKRYKEVDGEVVFSHYSYWNAIRCECNKTNIFITKRNEFDWKCLCGKSAVVNEKST